MLFFYHVTNIETMFQLFRYQIAVIILIYLLPLLVMLVTYSLVGQRLWGSKIPGEASDHYQNQIQAKRKVSFNIPDWMSWIHLISA